MPLLNDHTISQSQIQTHNTQLQQPHAYSWNPYHAICRSEMDDLLCLDALISYKVKCNKFMLNDSLFLHRLSHVACSDGQISMDEQHK